MNALIAKLLTKAIRFHIEEDGLALTEYLILLGIIAGGLIALVGVFGTDLGGAWTSLTNSVFGSSGLNTQTTTTSS
jgi:pilus assembly protein Flp/PilA